MPTSPFATPHTHTTALLTRNPLATSLFVYAVLTTRIYCRPDCPSRLARLANIRFYDTAAEAAAAGFRPCKRCTPERERGRRRQGEVVEKGCEIMRGGAGKAVRVGDVARRVGWTRGHFCRVFKRVRGVSVGEWVRGLERGREGTEGDVQVEVDVDVEEGMDEVDWEEWVDYSACSTPVLVPLTFPHLN